jgi:hypothetical chaperone protein
MFRRKAIPGPSPVDLSYVEAGLAAQMGVADLREHLAYLLARTVACARECVQRALQTEFAGVALVEGDLFGGVASGLAYSRG